MSRQRQGEPAISTAVQTIFLSLLRITCGMALLCAALPLRADDVAIAARSVVRVAVLVETAEGTFLAGHGSGFAVAPNRILTSAHVVESGGQPNVMIAVVPSQGRNTLPARIIDYAPDIDLAVLEIDMETVPAATLYSGAVASGAPVAAIGYPSAIDDAFQRNADDQIRPMAPEATRGWISSARPNSPFGTNVPGFTHTAAIGRGSSGGPLIDGCGRIVAINTAQSLSRGGDAEFAFATAAPVLVTYLRRIGIEAQITSAPCLDESTRTRMALEAAERRAAEAQRTAAAERQRAAQAQTQLEARLRAEARMREQILLLSLGLLVLALGGGGVAVWQGRRGDRGWAAAGLLVAAGAIAAIILVNQTPKSVMRTADDAMASDTTPAAPAEQDGQLPLTAGEIKCRINQAESRITLTDATDLAMTYDGNACINDQTLYAQSGDLLQRVIISTTDGSASMLTIDRASGRFTRDHYLLQADRFEAVLGAVAREGILRCNMPDAQRAVTAVNTAVEALLPQQPDQRFVWDCSSSG